MEAARSYSIHIQKAIEPIRYHSFNVPEKCYARTYRVLDTLRIPSYREPQSKLPLTNYYEFRMQTHCDCIQRSDIMVNILTKLEPSCLAIHLFECFYYTSFKFSFSVFFILCVYAKMKYKASKIATTLTFLVLEFFFLFVLVFEVKRKK